MGKLEELKSHLKRGKVYRSIELMQWSKSVDRHIYSLLNGGTLKKLYHGMYYYPKNTAFGKTSPAEDALIRCFLKGDRLLLTSPNLLQ